MVGPYFIIYIFHFMMMIVNASVMLKREKNKISNRRDFQI